MNVNWELLRKQKIVLLTMIVELEAAGHADRVAALEGIVNVIDALQDEAVDDHGVPEAEVFGEYEE